MLDMRTTLRCLARTWLVGAVMRARGLQHLGHLYALNPSLTALYEDPAALLRARTRYMRHTPHTSALDAVFRVFGFFSQGSATALRTCKR